jgi:Flp pilus assembly protein TadD
MLALVSLLSLTRWLELVPEEFRFEESLPLMPSHQALFYALALLTFPAAVLADASIGVLAAVTLLALLWWKRPIVTRRQQLAMIPFAAFALMAVGLAAWNVRSSAFLQLSFAGERAGASLLKLVAPVPSLENNLLTISPTWGGVAVTGVAIAAAAALLVYLRPRVPAGALVAIGLLLAGLLATSLFRPPMLRAPDVTLADASAHPAAAPLCAAAAFAILRLIAKLSPTPNGFARRLVPFAAAAVIPLALAASTLATTPRFADDNAFWAPALAADATRPVALRQLGAAALATGRSQEAERDYAAARDQNPADAEATAGLASALAARGQLHDAAIAYRQGLRAVGDDPRLLSGLAAVEARRGDAAEAIQLYQKALEKDPHSAPLHNDLALLLAISGQRDDAIAHYRKAIALDGASLAPRINLATALFQAGQYNEASDQLHEVIRLDPRNFEAYVNAGAMLASAKEYAKAERMFRSAVALRKDSKEAWQNLAASLDAQGRKKEAEWCLTQAQRIGAPAATPKPATSSTRPAVNQDMAE